MGKTQRGKREGTGPFEGSFQKKKFNIGRRQQKGQKCPRK